MLESAAPRSIFDFHGFAKHEIGRKSPFLNRILASLVGFGRPGDSVRAYDVPVLSNDHVHSHREVLPSQ